MGRVDSRAEHLVVDRYNGCETSESCANKTSTI